MPSKPERTAKPDGSGSARPTSPFFPCQDCIGAALRRATRTVNQHYESAFRGSGLRATQFTLLATLSQTGPLPMGTLAERLGLERTSLTRNLLPLEKRGLVGTSDSDDARVRVVVITKKGESAARAALGAWKKAQARVGAVLTRTGLQEVLDAVSD